MIRSGTPRPNEWQSAREPQSGQVVVRAASGVFTLNTAWTRRKERIARLQESIAELSALGKPDDKK